jgi:hypothetical protein
MRFTRKPYTPETDFGRVRDLLGSDQAFYRSLGFELAFPAHHWVKWF